jgi:spermidine/putrescine-binding protein
MHPREVWQEGQSPLGGGSSRRAFLRRGAAAGLLASGAGPLLQGCGIFPDRGQRGAAAQAEQPGDLAGQRRQAHRQRPGPETGATLQIYNWVAYVNQSCLDSFAKKYKCKVQLTTFNTMDEALAKLRSGLTFDVFMGVTVDVLGQLVESKLL